jgi:hypothetical protein
MVELSPLLASLPGSGVGVDNKVVTNYDLMPKPVKFSGHQPKEIQVDAPSPEELLGVKGSRIPESHESRMRSQFSAPDPKIYSAKRQSETENEETASWWASGERQMVPCRPYTSSSAPAVAENGDTSPKAERQRAELAAKEAKEVKAQKAKEAKGLEDQKAFILSKICNDPNVVAGSSEVYQAMGQVAQINSKLGLAPNNYGSYCMPTTNYKRSD